MIFVTVGTARDFSRLIKKVDEIAGKIKEEIIVQKGFTKYNPRNCKYFEFVSRGEFLGYIKKTDIVITHAGAGTIIECLKNKKPTITVPRRKKYNEHRNDHQMDVAKELEREGKVLVCYDVKNLGNKIKEIKRLRFEVMGDKESKIKTILQNFIDSCEDK